MIPFAILGASGRVGRMVTTAIRNSKSYYQDVPIQTRNSNYPNSPRHINWDIMLEPKALETWISNYGKLKSIVIFSGVTPATGVRMDDNIDLALQCFESARLCGVQRILLVSSSAVYGHSEKQPIPESAACYPVNDYGLSKLRMEEAVTNAAKQQGSPEVCFLRVGNVVGADALLLNAEKGHVNIDRFEDDRGPLRSYIAPGSLARVIASLATTPEAMPRILNIAAPKPVQMEVLAKAANLKWSFREAVDSSNQDITIDCSELLKFLSFNDGCSAPEKMIEDWKVNKCDDLDKAFF